MTKQDLEVEQIPWFRKVPSKLWDDWPGPESEEVVRLGDHKEANR
ncbi:hypothetical protein [Pleionea sediminis]|nr:hypothetical protein [Pleionea sediminis]